MRKNKQRTTRKTQGKYAKDHYPRQTAELQALQAARMRRPQRSRFRKLARLQPRARDPASRVPQEPAWILRKRRKRNRCRTWATRIIPYPRRPIDLSRRIQ